MLRIDYENYICILVKAKYTSDKTNKTGFILR